MTAIDRSASSIASRDRRLASGRATPLSFDPSGGMLHLQIVSAAMSTAAAQPLLEPEQDENAQPAPARIRLIDAAKCARA